MDQQLKSSLNPMVMHSPYFRTAESAKARHREIAAKNTPKSALHIATQDSVMMESTCTVQIMV